MNNTLLTKKPIFLLLILLTTFSLQGMQSFLFAQSPEDEFLIKAFANLKKNPPSPPTELQQKLIIQIKSEIENHAGQKRFYTIEKELVEEVGGTGFPEIADLLLSKEPWIRAFAAQTLFALDRQQSIPFLIGLLSDKGSFRWMRDVAGYTVSNHASGLISDAFHGTIYFRTPLGEENNSFARIKAVQNYYWFHLPFCEWLNKVCFVEYKNVIAQLENSRFPMPPNNDGYQGINYIYIDDNSNKGNYKLGEPINVSLGFLHYGNRIMRVRWDVRDLSIHKFKLIAPNGEELKLKLEGLPVLSNPVLQPQWSEGSLGKRLNLAEMYDVKQLGRYRFYYEYTPPQKRERDEQYRPVHMWHWNGKGYVNYYDFIVK